MSLVSDKYFELLDYFSLIRKKYWTYLASTSCKYKAPLKYPDMIYVGSKIYKISNDRFFMKYAIFSLNLKIITTEGDSVLVSYDYNSNKKIDFPTSIRNKILEIEKDIEII